MGQFPGVTPVRYVYAFDEPSDGGRELLGGNGIVADYNVARFFADAEALYSYEGTYQMQNLIVGKAITGIGSLGSLYLGKNRLGVSAGDTVTFHAVGDREPIERRLVELDRIMLG